MTQDEQARYAKACLDHVATVLGEAAGRAGLGVADLDWIMPDLTNAVFWRNVCRETGVGRDRVPLDLLPCAATTTASTRCRSSSTPTRPGGCDPATGARWWRSDTARTSRSSSSR